MHALNRPSPPHHRAAFTLVEMLVVVLVILVLSALAISAVNVATTTDRVAGSARQVQSFLEGARDRAIFAKKVRGVRFLRDTDANGSYCTRMMYLGHYQISEGRLQIDTDGKRLFHSSTAPHAGLSWMELARAGLLQAGTRIRIANTTTGPADEGLWYNIEAIPGPWLNNPAPSPAPNPEELNITVSHVELPTGTPGVRDGSNVYVPSATDSLAYKIELAPAILPASDPVQLVQGIVIDLNQSQTPSTWKVASNFTNQLDILFTPDGRMTGPAAGSGLIHLMIVDNRDRLEGRPAGHFQNVGDSSIITIFTRTGHITTHAVMVEEQSEDASGNPLGRDINGNTQVDEPEDDPFYYAKTGELPDEK